MIQALALPYVKGNQEKFIAAKDSTKMKSMHVYNACTREAAHAEHTADALKHLGWPSYTEQLQAAQTKVAAKIAEHRELRCLHNLPEKMPGPPENGIVAAKRQAQTWFCPPEKHRLSPHSFAFWGSRRLEEKALADKYAEELKAEQKGQALLRKQAKEAMKGASSI